MALETVIFPQYSMGYCGMESHAIAGGPLSCGIGKPEEEEEKRMVAAVWEKGGGADQRGEEQGSGALGSADGSWSPFTLCSSVMKSPEEWDMNSSSLATCAREGTVEVAAGTEPTRKRRRTKGCKNMEEVESQRMTHIAVERNRRKQMNEYLSVLRSLIPLSYVQRGDQASIVGGAINFAKELEQLLQSLEAQKRIKQQQQGQPDAAAAAGSSSSSPFSRFFTFPQYSTSVATKASPSSSATRITDATDGRPAAENRRVVADIEVTMVESHANVRVLSRRRPKQLWSLVAGLQGQRLSVLHLNMTTTVDQMVLYTFSLKVEEDCQLSSVEEIAAAVNQMLSKIQEETVF